MPAKKKPRELAAFIYRDGGRERSRTSDLYSVNFIRSRVYVCPPMPIEVHSRVFEANTKVYRRQRQASRRRPVFELSKLGQAL